MRRLQAAALNQVIETRQPRGTFYAKISPTQYIGVDNRTGDAWTEEFAGIRALRRWMNDETEVKHR